MYKEESDVEEIVSSLFRSASIAGHGRIDPFLSKPKSQHMTIKGMMKGTRNMLGRYVGKWFYDKGISLDAANNPYFSPMVNAIQRAGPGITPPTSGQSWMKRWRKLESGLKNINRVGQEHFLFCRKDG
ncbi:hypothetical protein AMTR_s00004p00269210 [Amborella trichopoda]|uniref:Uncharacterized protein n=1 Tax=Amborella trichopoda TaxID=13333 RepID=W1NF51_AMBTC|nr:hypothetical protein AMTR_s00004p00269210 [Amborella trichopoda]